MKRRKFINRSMIMAGGVLVTGLSLKGKSSAISPSLTLSGKKVLYVWGGWGGHEPEKCRDIFVPWLEAEGAEVIVSGTLDAYLDEKLMGSLDLIIQSWTKRW